MTDIINFIIEHRNEPITFSVVVGFFLLVLDKAARKLIQNHVKRMFKIKNMDDYAERQKRIERKLDALMERVGVQWEDVRLNGSDYTRRNNFYISSWVGSFPARIIEQFTNWREYHMKNINYVTLTAAILGSVKLIAQSLGYDIVSDDQINAISNGVAAIVTVFGVVMSHQKKENHLDSME